MAMCVVRSTSLLLLLLHLDIVFTECLYAGTQYAEDSSVPTVEPCLRCACVRAALLCQLRVCPTLPDPPPPGCIIVHRRRQCCPQLICHDSAVSTNKIEARFEPDLPEISSNQSLLGKGCVARGTIYASGSAMHTSTTCEFCYCLRGVQRCVRPSCPPPAPGCRPHTSAKYACCPTRYHCIQNLNNTISTSTTSSSQLSTANGCWVSRRWYPEGSSVVGERHTACARCFCVRGSIHCAPLECAPPLRGCTPIVRYGECCAASYNCSGIIEVQPLLNYNRQPDVSKDYAQLRQENQPKQNSPIHEASEEQPHYILAESSSQFLQQLHTPYYFTSTSSSSTSTKRQPVATTRHLPLENTTVDSSSKYSKISLTTTKIMSQVFKPWTTETVNRAVAVTYSPVYKPVTTEKTTKYSNYVDIDSSVDDYFDGRNNRRIDQISTEIFTSTTDVSTTELTTGSTLPAETTIDISTETSNVSNITITGTELIGNNTECVDATDEDVNLVTTEEVTTTDPPTTALSPRTTSNENNYVFLESKYDNSSTTLIPFKTISPNIDETLVNITKTVNKKDEDYEYDYNEPSLPPSLPNLKIIPFVAADAVVEEKVPPTSPYSTSYPSQSADTLREAEDSLYGYSLFSPPMKTEGGFVPRDPPHLDEFYNTNVDLTTEVNTRRDDCLVNGVVVQHGEVAPSQNTCTVCLCLFGSISCSPSTCAPAPQGCRRLQPTAPICCGPVVCDKVPDPFQDVIRTEPAPDLQLLMGDRHSQDSEMDTFYDSLYKLLGGNTDKPTIHSTTSTPLATEPNKNSVEEVPLGGVGPLKLAGCNIYGRMYRVGKLIAELSGPCLECRCTHTGVQCHSLQC